MDLNTLQKQCNIAKKRLSFPLKFTVVNHLSMEEDRVVKETDRAEGRKAEAQLCFPAEMAAREREKEGKDLTLCQIDRDMKLRCQETKKGASGHVHLHSISFLSVYVHSFRGSCFQHVFLCAETPRAACKEREIVCV